KARLGLFRLEAVVAAVPSGIAPLLVAKVDGASQRVICCGLCPKDKVRSGLSREANALGFEQTQLSGRMMWWTRLHVSGGAAGGLRVTSTMISTTTIATPIAKSATTAPAPLKLILFLRMEEPS